MSSNIEKARQVREGLRAAVDALRGAKADGKLDSVEIEAYELASKALSECPSDEQIEHAFATFAKNGDALRYGGADWTRNDALARERIERRKRIDNLIDAVEEGARIEHNDESPHRVCRLAHAADLEWRKRNGVSR